MVRIIKGIFSYKALCLYLLVAILSASCVQLYFTYEKSKQIDSEIVEIKAKLRSVDRSVDNVLMSVDGISDIDNVRSEVEDMRSVIDNIEWEVTRISRAFRY